MFLKIPPTSAGFFEASVILSFQHHGLHRKWNSYSFYQPLRENNYQTAKNLCIQELANFVYYSPHQNKNRNLYEVIWHNSFDTPEFSHLLDTHTTQYLLQKSNFLSCSWDPFSFSFQFISLPLNDSQPG
jgi:hypothetical protein